MVQVIVTPITGGKMKKMMLFASLGVVGFVLAPIASAGAAEATGSCKIEGTATFTPELSVTAKKGVGYSFTSTGGTCVSTPAAKFEEATVSGKGELSCLKGTEEGAGSGTLKAEIEGKKEVHTFAFEFVAVGPFVAFKATGGVTAVGAASFASDTKGIEECEKGKGKELKFQAVTAGKI